MISCHHRLFTAAAALGLAAMVSGSCAHTQNQPAPSPADIPSERLSAGALYLPKAPEPLLLLDVVDSEKTGQDALKHKEGRFFFALRDAELRQALIALARDRDTSLVVGAEVQGKVTVDLKNVTVEEALESLVRPTFDFTYDGRTIRVFKPVRITETFKVDYIAGSRSGSSQVTATSSGSSTSGGSSTGGGNAFASASSVQSDFKADFWEQLDTGIKALLSKDGVASVHRMAGLVTVTDVSDRVKAVRTYLDRIGTEVHGQVLIQAELVEVALDSAFEAGVDWTRLTALLGGALSVAHTTAGNPTSGLSFAYQRGSNPVNANAILRALETQGKVEVLSRPRVLTLNNQKALMKVGREDVFFATTLVPGLAGAVAGGAALPFSVSTPRTITVGILLDVSPQIRANGKVALHVHLSITEKFGVATAPDNSATAPILDVREADAVVEVESGQTLSIGGLTQVREADKQEGVPFLSKLPIVGWLFRHRLQEKRKVELVLLMTPVVLKQSVTQVSPVGINGRGPM